MISYVLPDIALVFDHLTSFLVGVCHCIHPQLTPLVFPLPANNEMSIVRGARTPSPGTTTTGSGGMEGSSSSGDEVVNSIDQIMNRFHLYGSALMLLQELLLQASMASSSSQASSTENAPPLLSSLPLPPFPTSPALLPLTPSSSSSSTRTASDGALSVLSSLSNVLRTISPRFMSILLQFQDIPDESAKVLRIAALTARGQGQLTEHIR